MSGGIPPNHDLLEAYLDGRLSGQSRADFERRLGAEPALRAQVELQKSIDGSLGKLFGGRPPLELRRDGAPAAPPRTAEALKLPAPSGRRLYALLGLAAALVLAGAALWYTGVLGPSTWGTQPHRKLVSPESAYRTQEAAQFLPDFKCENDKQFAEWVRVRYQHELLVKPAPGLEVTGWTYYAGSAVLSNTTALLLTKVDGKDVVVIMDRARNDRELSIPASSGLHLFKRLISSVVLYEVSPLSEEKVLPRFYDPQDSTCPPPP